MSNAKSTRLSNNKTGWADVLQEANRQLRLTEGRRKRLLSAISIFRKRVKEGAPFPGLDIDTPEVADL